MARKSERRTWSEWFRGDGKTKARKRLAVEILEDRAVPATVTNLLDGPDAAQPIAGSLRAAIIEASRTNGQVDFDPSLFANPGRQTLVLNGAVGALVINSGQNITITGPGSDKLTIQSDYGFTAASASSTGANFRQGDQLRQKRDTSGSNGYQGGAIFTVTSINDAADSNIGNGIGSITGVTVTNPGSNGALLGTQVTLSQSLSGQFQLEPINGATGTGASVTVLGSSYGLNPGIITQQMSVAGNNTLTISGITFGDTNGNAITHNLGNLVINNCAFGAFDGTVTNAKSDPTNISFNKFLLPGNNPGNFNILRENSNFIYSDVGAGNLTVGTSSFTNAAQRAIDFTPTGSTLSVSATTGNSSSFQSNDIAAIRAATQTVSIANSSFTANGDGTLGEGPLRLTGTTSVSLTNVSVTANIVNPASTSTQGGVLITGGAVTITGASVSGNIPNASSTQGAFRITTTGAVTISKSVFDSNNTALASQFRAVEILGNPSSTSISDSAFTNNTAGGALAIRANTSNITNSYFANNTASRTLPAAYGSAISGISGGAALVSTGAGITNISGSVFRNNSLATVTTANSGGGAVFSDIGGLNIDKSVFEGNKVAITGFPASFPLPDPTIYSTNPERQPAPRYSGGGAIRSGFSTVINATEFANNTVTSVVDFWLPPNAVSPSNPAIPAHGGGGALYLTRDTDNSSINRITNTTFFGNSSIQISQATGNANIQSTGKGLTGGALIIADGRSPSVPNYTATDAPRAGTSATQIINTTITGNSLVNPFADKFNSNYLSGVNAYTNADTGGIFNDTRTGSTITTLNTINVQNTGIIYNSPANTAAPGDPNFGLANTGSRVPATIPPSPLIGTFGSAGYTMANPLTSPGFTITGTPGNLTGSDQNSGIDSKGLQDNLGPTVGISTGAVLPGVASNSVYQSILQSVAIDRLSPARDSGLNTTVAPFNIPTDVRGVPRFINVAVDLGAVELQTTTKTTVTSAVPGTIEYGQVQTVDIRVDFDDSKASAANITGDVRLVTIIPDSQGNNIITEYGRTTLTPTTGASPPNSTATVTLNPDALNLLPPGSNILFAQFLGDNTYVTSLSSPFTLNIAPATTTTKFAASVPNPANIATDTTILFTGSVAITHPGSTPVSTGLLPTGTVTLSQRQVGGSGFTDLVTAPLQADGSFSISLTGTPTIASVLANGVYDIRARFNPADSSKFATDSTDSGQSLVNGGDIKQEVGLTPTIAVSFLDSMNNVITTIERGEVVTLQALVTPDDTDLVQPGSVTFIRNGVDLLTVARSDSGPGTGGHLYAASVNTGDSQYSFLVNATPYQITARYNRNDSGIYNTTVSPASSLTITNQTTVTTLTVTPVGPVFYGDKVDLIATTAPRVSGSPIPFAAGSISFNDTVDALLSGPNTTPANANPSSSFSTTSLSVGSHSLTASYSGDGTNYAASTSSAISLTVNKATTTTAFTSVPSPAIVNLGSSITFNIAVATPAINAPLKPTGTVTFVNTTTGVTISSNIVINPMDGLATYSYTPPDFTPGDAIIATYSGDTNYAGSSSTIVVTVPSLTLDVISSTPVQRGSLVTLRATIDPAGNDVDQPGSVDFLYGSTVITSIPRSASTAVAGTQVYSATINTGDDAFSLFVNANPYSIQARYNQNGGNFPSLVSNSQNLSIILQDTSTTLSINPSQASFTFGDRIDISALTTPAITGSIIPFAAGNLGFDDNAVLLNGPNATIANSNPFSIFSTTGLSVGSHSLTASYSGDGTNYAASTSSAINLTINQASTTTAFTSIPSPAIVNLGSSITFNIAVATPAINAPLKPAGSVVFSNAAGVIATVPVNQASGIATYSYTPPAFTSGDTITATYSGDTNYTGSSSTLIVTVPNFTLSPIAASPVQRGNSITLSATMDPADNDVNQPGSVDFFYGSTVITSVPRSASTVVNGKQVYSATINTGDNAFSLFVNANPYSIQARYNQNGGNVPTVTSGVQTLTVTTQNTTTSLASPLFPSQASGSLIYGNRFDLSAALAPAISGSIIPFASQATGIRILDNGVVIATLPVSNDSRSPVFSKTDFAVGTHVLTAQFIGDGNYAMSTSQPFTLAVTPASTSLNLTSSGDYLALGQTFALNASILSNAQTMPTQISGIVGFTAIGPNGTTNLPVGAISVGKASSTFTPTLPGKYTITANYSGDANYQASSATRSLTASSISIEVADANGLQTISTAPRGSSVTLTARLTPADSAAIDTLTGLPVQPGSVSFRLSNGTVITAVARDNSSPINGSQVYSATINTGNNLFSLPVGVATISARYNANGGLYPQVDSATPSTLTITRQATTTALTTPAVTSIPYGSAVSFSASVAPVIAATGDNVIPFGNSQIQFFNASALIQTSQVNDTNRSATLSLDLLPVGSYLISARYAGDNTNYLASRSTDSAPAFALGVTQAVTTTTLSLSSSAIDSGSSVLLTATVGSGATGNALRPSGTVNFFNNGTPIGSGTVNQATGVVTFSYRPPTVGGYSLSATYAGDANYSVSSSAASSSLVVNTFQPFYAIAMQGGSKFATFNTRTNALIATYQPNGPRYTGGFTLARGDVNGDGVADLLWATNRGSFVRIIDGLTSHDLGGFFGFNSNFNSPVSIAVGDINKDGKGDIMVAAAGRNAGGIVRVYSGANYGQLLYQGSPYGERFGGGISLASGDVDGDGWADIISSPLAAGVARVVVVSGKTQSTIRNFLAHTPGYTGGLSVAAADLNNDGLAEIITATSSGRGIVSVFDGSAPFTSGVQAPALGQLVIGGPRFTGGARVAVVSDINGDGISDLLTTMGPGGGAGAARYSFNATTRNFQLIDSLFAFSSRDPGANNGLRPA